MRLGLLIYGGLDSRSGGYLYDRQLVQELKLAGDEVEVISLSERNYARYLLDSFSQGLMDRLASAPYDVLLQDELNHPSLFLINRRLRRRAVYPLVAIVHHLRSSETSRLMGFYRLIEGSYLKTLDGVIINSASTKRSIEALVHLPGVVAPPGRDHIYPQLSAEDIVSRAHQPGTLKVIFIGNLIRRKGLDVLLRALARLPRETWTLAVAGNPEIDPRYSREMARLCKTLGIDGQVEFHGYCSAEDKNTLLMNGHILAVPSQYEGFGIVYLEAMGFGLVPLASAAGGAGDLIRQDDNGYLIHPGDSEKLATILGALHTDRALLARLSLAARRTFEAHPTWPDCGRVVRSFLDDLR